MKTFKVMMHIATKKSKKKVLKKPMKILSTWKMLLEELKVLTKEMKMRKEKQPPRILHILLKMP